MRKDFKLVFLSYLNRSGSTLLAQKLNDYAGIEVSIEEDFLDGIREGHFQISNLDELNAYLKSLLETKKFKLWDVSIERIKDQLIHYSYPISYREVLSTILSLYFKDSKASTVIHKKGVYFKFRDKVKKEFPNSKLLFIERDPRAIFNSQKKSINSVFQRPMQSSVFKFCLRYKHAYQLLEKWGNDELFLKVNYENLIHHFESEMACVLNFLEISDTTTKKENTYFQQIPEEQKHLHSNLNKQLQTDRSVAWKTELTSFEINFLQKTLNAQLKQSDYKIYSKPLHIVDNILLKLYCTTFNIIYFFYALNRRLRD